MWRSSHVFENVCFVNEILINQIVQCEDWFVYVSITFSDQKSQSN